MANTESRAPRVAWAVHIFTMSGIIAAFLSLKHALDDSPRASLLWMMVAMVIDGLDGPIARKFEVATVLPSIDGHIMDLVIDYVACVVAPAFFMHIYGQLPRSFDPWGIAIILLTSLWLFANTNIQTEDNYFNGFPAMWNLVVTIMFVLQSRPVVNVIIVIVLCVATVVPIKFIHPIRVRDFRKITVPILVVWVAAMVYLIVIVDQRTMVESGTGECTAHCLPGPAIAAQIVVYAGAVWIIGVGLWRTVRGDRDVEQAVLDASETTPS